MSITHLGFSVEKGAKIATANGPSRPDENGVRYTLQLKTIAYSPGNLPIRENVQVIINLPGIYNGINDIKSFNFLGMILLSELSRRRIRSINKLVRVGRDECAVVVRVDRDKGYIDLSKRRLSDDEKKRCENKFEKVRCVCWRSLNGENEQPQLYTPHVINNRH